MGALFAEYKVGLVLTRSGLNDRQLVFLKHHLREVARRCGCPVTLVVPVVISHATVSGGPDARRRTDRLVAPLRDSLGPWLTIEVLDVADVVPLMPHLAKLDEVWCATSRGSGSEWYMRPGFVHARAQTMREAPRFRMLHYWVELDPKLLPGIETKRGKKQRPALKGY